MITKVCFKCFEKHYPGQRATTFTLGAECGICHEPPGTGVLIKCISAAVAG